MNNRIFVNSPILLSEFCRGKRTRRIVAAISAFCMLTVGSPTAFAGTSLLGGKAVLEGLTRVTQGATTADSVTFNSSAKVGILDWSKYNIGSGQSMTYNGAGTTFFNLVNGAAGKSQIDGMINGNGSVWVINPSGVAFGSESVVNVGGVFGVSAKALTDDCLEKLRSVDAMPEGGLTFKEFTATEASATEVRANEVAEAEPESDPGNVLVSKGAQFNGNDIDFTTGDWAPGKQVALVGKSVKVEEGAFLNADKVNIAAANSAVMAKVDSVGDGTVSLNISAFKDVDADINVTFGGVADAGPVEAVGNLTAISEGNIAVEGSIKAGEAIEFRAGKSASDGFAKSITVTSGKYVRGNSVKAEASGAVTIGEASGAAAEMAALDGALEITAGQDINVVNATVKAGTFTVNESMGAVKIPTGHDAQNLTLTSGGKITVEGASRVGASKDVTFQKLTGTDPAVSGGDIAIKGGSKVAANGNLNVDANGAVSVDSATVVARGTLGVTAGKGVSVDNGAAVKSSGNLTVTANGGAIEIGKTAAATVAAGENAHPPALAVESTVSLGATKYVNVGVGSKVLATKDVAITAGGNVNMHGAVEAKGTATLQATGAGKSVKVGNGTDAASVTGAKVALEGGLSAQVQDGSTVTATGADGVSMKGAGYVLVDANASVSAANGAVTLTANDGEAAVPAELISKAGIQVTGAVEGKTVAATAKKGSILVDANGSVKATDGVASLSATGAQEGQGVQVNGSVAGKAGVTVDSGRGVTISGANATVLAGDVDTTKPEETTAQDGVALSVKAAKDVLVTGGARVASSGTAGLTATAGKLTVNGASQVGAAKNLMATAGDALEVSGGSKVAANGAATVTGGNGVTVDGSSVESVGDLTVKATDGNVLVKAGRVGSDGAVSVTAEKGNVRIGEKDTADTSVITGESGVSMKAKGYIEQSVGAKAVSKNGNVGYEAEGNVNMHGAVEAKGAATLQATGADKSVKVGNGTDVASVTGAKVALEGGLSAQVQDGSTVTATGADGVSMKGVGYVLVDANASVSAANGAVTLTANEGNADVPAEQIEKAGVQVTGAVEGKSVTATAKKGSILVDANGSVKATDGVATLSATGAQDGQGVRINGEVTGKMGVTVDSGRDVTISGANATVLAGDVDTTKPEETTAQDGVSLSVTAANDVFVAGGAKVASSGSAGLTATAGDLTVNGGSQVGAAKNLTATAGDALEVLGNSKVAANGAATVTGANGVTVDGSSVESVGNLTVTATTGDLVVKGAARLGTGGKLTANAVAGSLKVQGTAVLTAGGEGDLDGNSGVEIASGAKVLAKGNATLDATEGAVTVKGLVKAGPFEVDETTGAVTPASPAAATLGIAGKAVDVDGGKVASSGNLTLTATDAAGTGVKAQAGAKVATAGNLTVGSAAAVAVDNATVAARGTLGVTAAKGVSVDSGAALKSSGNLTVTANGGAIEIGKTAAATVAAGENSPAQASTVKLDAQGAVTVANGSSVLATANVDVDATGAATFTSATVVGKTGVTVDSGAKVTVDGGVVKAGAFAYVPGEVPTIGEGDAADLTVTAKTGVEVKNNAALGASQDLTLTKAATGASGDITVSGSQVAANRNLAVDSAAVVSVSGGSAVAANGAATVTGANGVSVDGSTVESVGDLTVTATTGDLVVKGAARLGTDAKLTATATAGSLKVQGTAVLTAGGEGDLDGKAGVEIATGAKVLTKGNATVDATEGAVTVKGLVKAGPFEVDEATGATTPASPAAATLGIAGKAVDVDGGKVASSGNLTLTATDASGAGVKAQAGAKVATAGNLTVGSANAVSVSGGSVVAAKGTATVTGANGVTVDGSTVESGGDLTVTATTGDLVAKGASRLGTDGKLTANAVAGSLKVQGTAVLTAGGEGDLDGKTGVEVASGAKVLTKGNATVDATEGAVTVKGLVKAGDFEVDEATGATTPADPAAATLGIAGKAVDVDGGKVAASGDLSVTATDAAGTGVKAQNGAKVATLGDLTVDSAAAVSVSDASKVAVKGTATVTGANGVTVDGSSVESVGDLTVTATKGDLTANNAKLGTDGVLTANAAAGNLTAQGASVLIAKDNVSLTAKNAVTVTGTAVVEAGKAVSVKSTEAGDITVDTTKSVTANDGAVTIHNGSGAVTVQNATVEAKGATGDVDIDATTGITIAKGTQNATVKAAQNVTVDNATKGDIVIGTTGDTTDESALTATAGKVAVNNAAADVEVLGGAKVTAKTDVDVDAKGSFLADDSVAVKAETGKLTADAATGSITVADKADIDVKTTLGLAAGTFVKVTENAQVGADDAITVTANGGDVTVDASADVTSAKGVAITASKGVDVLDDATVTANGGDAVLTAQTEDVKVTGDIAASANVAVNANTTAEVSDNGTVKATAGNVSAVAQNAVTVKDTAKIEGDGVLLKGAAVTTIGSASVKSTGTGTGGNLLIKATDSDVSLGQGTTIAASRNLKVEAAENVNQDTDLTAGGTAYVKAGSGDVNMKVGTTTRTSGGNARFEAGQDMNIANVDVGEGGVSFDGRSVTVSGRITAGGIGADLDGSFGTRENPVKLSVSELAVSAKKGIFIENSKDVRVVSQSAATETFQVNDVQEDLSDGGKVPTDSSVSGPVDGLLAENGDVELKNQGDVTVAQSARIQAGSSVKADAEGNFTVDGTVTAGGETDINADGGVSVSGNVEGSAVNVDAGSDIAVNGKVHSGGETALTAQGGITVAANATVDGSTVRAKAGGAFKIDGNVKAGGENNVEAGGDVTFGSSGVAEGSTVAVKAGGSITQSGASLSVRNGYLSQNSGVRAAVKASNTATLTAGGSVGGAVSGSQMQYIGVDAGRVSASAGSGNAVIAAANGKSLTVGEGGIRAPNGTAAVYTSKTISTPGNAVIEGRNVNVTAHDYQPGTVNIKVTDRLTANNIEGGMNPGIAIFTTKGGKSNPSIDNLPNNMLIFIDGRLAGGDMMMINKLGALEAFPVATPELKSEQGIFGNPVFLHDQLDVSNPLAVGAIDFLLEDRAELTYGAEFPAEADMQIAINGLSPTTSYRFGQNGEEGSENGEKGTGNGEEGTAK